MIRPMMVALLMALTGAAALAQSRQIASPPGESASEVLGRHDERQGYVGGKWLEIKYGRPIKRGRNLFGLKDSADALNDGAPVWRAGANVSTRLKTEVPLTIGGTAIAPGEYTMFIDLKPNAWTFIVSRWAASPVFPGTKDALFGAFDYTPAKDVVRVPMKLETLTDSVEQLTWNFENTSDAGGRLAMTWDRMKASVPFTVAK